MSAKHYKVIVVEETEDRTRIIHDYRVDAHFADKILNALADEELRLDTEQKLRMRGELEPEPLPPGVTVTTFQAPVIIPAQEAEDDDSSPDNYPVFEPFRPRPPWDPPDDGIISEDDT
jgi:hypothetical protein